MYFTCFYDILTKKKSLLAACALFLYSELMILTSLFFEITKDQLSKIKGVKEKKQNGVLKKYARQQGMTKDHARGFNWKFKVSVDDKDRYFLRRQT